MIVRLCLYLSVIACLTACEGKGEGGENQLGVASQTPTVVAVNYPLTYMAEQIAGDLLNVEFPVNADVDPAYWQPDVTQVVAVQQAELIFLNGAAYAQWIEKVSLPEEKLINTSAGFSDLLLPLERVATHTHGIAGEHTHADLAFTTWLDLQQAKLQAMAIYDALVGLLPEREAQLTANLAVLDQDFESLDQRWLVIGPRLAAEGVIFSHPVYQYWQRRYQVAGSSLHWEPDVEPEASEWRALDQPLQQKTIRWMVWEAEPLPVLRTELAARGIESLILPPVANRPTAGDMMTILNDATRELETKLQLY
ncbi:MAG: zinc ABC transporter substrate-binding protein [Pseudomonadales bacterium]